jgi:CBS domain containing-hemolysin-like protein
MEAVLLSTPKSFLIVKVEKGNKWATLFTGYKENIDKPLSAILSLNTVAHTVGAAGVGAQAIKVFGEASFGVVSAVLTVLILVITEIIPKTLGARYWRSIAKVTAYLIRVTIFIAYPLVIASSAITRLISSKNQQKTTSREEIAALASIGADEGIFSSKEDKILQNILRLKNVKVKEIMTPRVVVVGADEDMKLIDFLANKEHLKFSRIPIYAKNDENITGYVLREMVLEHLAEDKHELLLKDIKRSIIAVPNTIVLISLWEKLLEQKEHIALIVDEYGGMDGIVTMEDIIETLLGLEIVDEKDVVTDMQEYARKRWKEKQVKYNFLGDTENKGKS